MTEREARCAISATDAAVAALDELAAEHGPLILHITAGGDDSGTPLCLPAGELRLGARDLYLGSVRGVEVFEMRSHADAHFRGGGFTLDVIRGVPVGFSLVPGDGLRFTVRETVLD